VHPVLLALGNWHLFSYGTLIALGGALSCGIWHSKRVQMGLKTEDDFWLLINVILFGGFLGGRILFIIEYVPFTAADVIPAVFSFSKGFSVLGAFVGVVSGVGIMARRRRIAFLRLLDYVSLVAPFWHVFGRLGCFAAGCCYGRPSGLPWAVRFRDPASLVPENLLGIPLHPTQLYEASGDLGIFVAMYFLILPRFERGRLQPGTLTGLYFASYGVLRFFTEFYRGDAVRGFLGMTAGQLLSVALIAAGAVVAVWVRRPPCIPT